MIARPAQAAAAAAAAAEEFVTRMPTPVIAGPAPAAAPAALAVRLQYPTIHHHLRPSCVNYYDH